MEDSGARNARSFYTQRLRRPRGIVRLSRWSSSPPSKSLRVFSFFSFLSLSLSLSLNVSRRFQEQSVTLWTRVRSGARATLENSPNERKNGQCVRFILVFRGKKREEKKKVVSVWLMLCKQWLQSVRIFPACAVSFPSETGTTNVGSRASKALVVSPKWLIASPSASVFACSDRLAFHRGSTGSAGLVFR